MCTPADGSYTITYMADANNNALCPPAATTEMVVWPPDSGTPFPGCTCAGNTLTCPQTIQTDGGTVTETTTFTFTSTNFTGTESGTEDGITCNYTFTGTMN
jgi:hypothetical protein